MHFLFIIRLRINGLDTNAIMSDRCNIVLQNCSACREKKHKLHLLTFITNQPRAI